MTVEHWIIAGLLIWNAWLLGKVKARNEMIVTQQEHLQKLMKASEKLIARHQILTDKLKQYKEMAEKWLDIFDQHEKSKKPTDT